MISLCMIVWNEEQLLPTAIASAEGLADEVVVVDTGSSDRTMEVARECGARIFSGADRTHKGESRNLSLDMARGDWCVVLDADERIADPVGLRQFLEGTDAQAVYIRLAFMDANDNPTLTYPQMRIWRKGAFRYKYRAHEVPVPVDGWGELAHTEFVWEHRPPPDRTWKTDYTLSRLLVDVKENPGDPRPMYYLGRQYKYRQEWADGVKWLSLYLENPGCDQADAWADLAACYAGLGDKQQQIIALYRACAADPMRRDWWGSLAELYHAEGKDEIAAGLLRCALEIPLPAGTYAHHYWHGPHIHDLLARCLWKLGRYEEGHDQACEAVRLAPDDKRLRDNLRWFEDKVRDIAA